MNYYFLPGIGIYGGIKVGFQFAGILNELGVRIVVATPEGLAPTWFRSLAPVVDRDAALASLGVGDTAFFSLPFDHEPLRRTGARLVFHCQGTDPAVDPVLADRAVTVLTCWAQARDYVIAAGRSPIEVGISISDCFYYDGTPKHRDMLAYMPRRGSAIAQEARASATALAFQPLDNLNEIDVARAMKRSVYYLATSDSEWFGLPALEAMAAGCVVVTVPVVGGNEYLREGVNCLISPAAKVPSVLATISKADAAGQRARLSAGAMAMAARYRSSLQKEALRTILHKDLGAALSWT